MFLKISQNLRENNCARVSFLMPATLIKKRLWHRCFPVNFEKFLRTPFLIEHLWWLLLNAMWVSIPTCIIVLANSVNDCWLYHVLENTDWKTTLIGKYFSDKQLLKPLSLIYAKYPWSKTIFCDIFGSYDVISDKWKVRKNIFFFS